MKKTIIILSLLGIWELERGQYVLAGVMALAGIILVLKEYSHA